MKIFEPKRKTQRKQSFVFRVEKYFFQSHKIKKQKEREEKKIESFYY